VDLKTRIAKAEHDFTNPAKGKRSRAELPADALALVGRIATELVAGTVVGTFIGWLLDQWLGTIPLFMVILFFFGNTSRDDEYLENGYWPRVKTGVFGKQTIR